MTIRIDQPRQLDLVGDPILIGGIGTGFEATLSYRVGDGHDEVTGTVHAGGGSGEHGQFQVSAEVSSAAFTLDRLYVQVFEVSPKDGSELHVQTVPVVYGPRIVPGYYGYREYKVIAGDTLWSIAQANYGDGALFTRIVRANPALITDPDQIYPGQVLRIPMGA